MNGKYKLVFTRGHTVDGRLDNEEGDDPSMLSAKCVGACAYTLQYPKYTHEAVTGCYRPHCGVVQPPRVYVGGPSRMSGATWRTASGRCCAHAFD